MIRLAFVLSLLAGPASAEHSPFLLPAAPPWSLGVTEQGKTREYVFPRDRDAIQALPEKERIHLLKRIELIERNQSITREIGKAFFADNPKSRYLLTPDYARSLTEVAVSISYTDVGAENPLYRHLPILRALPEYSNIHIIGPSGAHAAVQRVLAHEGLGGRARTHLTDTWNKNKKLASAQARPTRWVRDMFMVASTEKGKAAIYLPLAYSDATDLKNSDLNHIRNRWHETALVVSVPAFFRGGNIAVAANSTGQRKAFLGWNEVHHNEALYRYSAGATPPPTLMNEIVKRMAGTDEVVLLKNSEKLFHLDMAFSFLGPGLAAVLAPIDEAHVGAEDLLVLAEARKALAAQGFRVVPVPTTAARIAAFQSAANILPFTDKRSNKRRAIVPLFPDASVTINGRRQSLNEAVESAYEAAGVEVIWAEDRFSDRNGNVHCTIIGLH